jgi:putative ABC transport system permease protein
MSAAITKSGASTAVTSVTAANVTLGPANHLTLADATTIAERFPRTVEAVSPIARADDIPIRMGDADCVSDIFGVTRQYATVNNAPIKRGRYFTDVEVETRAKVCLVGASIADRLTGDPDTDLVGQEVAIQRQKFKIIGMTVPKGTGANGQDQDDQILVPITTAMDRVFNQRYINQIGVSCTSIEMMPLAQEQISNLLRSRHKVPPPYPDNDDFSIRNQTDLMARQRNITDTMTSMLSAVAVVSLVIGGVGIMNVMLVSVTERTREIGIRKAIGATPRDILLQFLIESAFMALMGGLLGVALGVGGAVLLAEWGGWNTIVNPTSVAGALTVSAGVGLFFGVYPASKAAALHPIQALRYE